MLEPVHRAGHRRGARAGPDDVRAAVAAAADALPDWAATPPRERSEVLRRTFELMIARREELAYPDVAGDGQVAHRRARRGRPTPPSSSAGSPRRRCASTATLRTAPSGTNRILTFRKPVGVGAAAHPVELPGRDGHPQARRRRSRPAARSVLKPAEDTPLTALLLAQLLTEAGLPAGVVNVLTTDQAGRAGRGGAGRRPGAQAVLHRVDRASDARCCGRRRTGSSTRRWNSAATTRSSCSTTPISTPRSTGAMLAKMRNGGQACTAANRFLVAGRRSPTSSPPSWPSKMGALRVGARHGRGHPTRPDDQRARP